MTYSSVVASIIWVGSINSFSVPHPDLFLSLLCLSLPLCLSLCLCPSLSYSFSPYHLSRRYPAKRSVDGGERREGVGAYGVLFARRRPGQHLPPRHAHQRGSRRTGQDYSRDDDLRVSYGCSFTWYFSLAKNGCFGNCDIHNMRDLILERSLVICQTFVLLTHYCSVVHTYYGM